MLVGTRMALESYFLLRIQNRQSLGTAEQVLRDVLRLPVEFFTQRYGRRDRGREWRSTIKVARLLSGDLARQLNSRIKALLFALLMLLVTTPC